MIGLVLGLALSQAVQAQTSLPSGARGGQFPTTGPGTVRPAQNLTASGDSVWNREQALIWAERTRQTISSSMHRIETEHFLIFSAWHRTNDRALAQVCEQMYAKLRTQFRIPASQPAWPGQLPVYIFWNRSEFDRFTTEIDKTDVRSSEQRRVNGYHATRGPFAYIVINGVSEPGDAPNEATQRFYEVLVHEGTHAFMSGFINRRPIARWADEGVAEFMAALLVPGCEANSKQLESTREALLYRAGDVPKLFGKTDLSGFDYGIAHSLVRYLIQNDSRAFVRFIEQMKKGQNDEAALKKTYGVTREELLQRWLAHHRFLFARSGWRSGAR